MLGRLLNTAASSLNPAAYASRNSSQLESVTEEEHTSGLLFPDSTHLRRSNTHAYPLQTSVLSPNASAASSFDDRGGLELDATRDFRVIIAQNALGDRDEPCILLDSQNLSPIAGAVGLGLNSQVPEVRYTHSRSSSLSKSTKRDPSHKPHASESHQSTGSLSPREPDSPMSSALFRARYRSSTLSPAADDNRHYQNRMSADSTESGLLNCIFGSSAFSYRGSSTKMHILPTETESVGDVEGFGSHGPRQRVPLTRGYTSGPSSNSSGLSQERLGTVRDTRSNPTRITVLVTRMFSVNLPEGRDPSAVDQTDQDSSPTAQAFKDSKTPLLDPSKRKKIKEKKTPMYAVAIIIKLPLAGRSPGRPSSQWNAQRQTPGWISASLDSDHKYSSSFFDDNAGLSATSSLDDRIDFLVDHWDVITRTLSHLEKLASIEILVLLQRVDHFSTQQPKPAKASNMQRTNQTIVQLPPRVLSGKQNLRSEAMRASQRISMALRIPQVTTGQSRWGVWREEARWIAKFLSDKEHNFFFLVLLTAFLGNHTEWLSALGPDWYRRRYHLQQRAHQDAEPSIPSRTVIVSTDKMTARRLIFVLSAFLPAQQRPDAFGSPLRPSTSTSMRLVSQSPPGAPILRKESLRRAINRRARARHFNDDENDGHRRSPSASSNEAAAIPLDDGDFVKTVPDHYKFRRDSDVRSIRTASLPIPSSGASTRKSATATIATAAPGTATPVPHFASQKCKHGAGGGRDSALDPTGSAASANLLQNLRRSESSNLISEGGQHFQSSRWGGLLSGLWGTRETFSESGGSSSAAGRSKRSASITKADVQQVKPEAASGKSAEDIIKNATNTAENMPIATASADLGQSGSSGSCEQNSKSDAQTANSPVKLSVGLHDGVIDVEVPLPGFISLSSSGDSTLASPKKTRTSAASFDVGASVHSAGSGFHLGPTKDYDGVSVNVAGWLRCYHEDFILQAVHPYNTLESDIKRSMSSEPTPPQALSTSLCELYGSNSEKWVEVCTTLVADTKTFTVKKLRLRRKISSIIPRTAVESRDNSRRTSLDPSETPSSTSQLPNFFSMASKTPTSPFSQQADSFEVEEMFTEEPVMDLDPTLVDAVEKVLARSGESSLSHSRAPSPNRSRKDKPPGNHGPDKQSPHPQFENAPSAEVPRNKCRRIVLGALEEVVRSVTAECCHQDPASTTGDASKTPSGCEQRGASAATDNTLREGIRKWLLDIEEAC
ncbi:uncharacterized protein PADG_05448 [Paracoccidioides brasiliensis Pb18]|uniref:Folliculin-interacting protein N-terminal domain-containing protein n=1 Tax=Paracoccidioides brasiliensis (strain Pb18) TaxID=502780 RepID=C1GDW2_PARBD|nr:uncharacterized protein PADG_05448 [Paracoccidioides brasiliensis Pb18]EEH49369.1 hypothetical protein PADG_05448 [Paracoccidioides brasiliensis Pb18]